ncbi:MAG TPA: DUF222 domain-containing protein [Actinomycetota bacterium]|nr:DUF222 domain-containing protein [Actinomycetota bacterium]
MSTLRSATDELRAQDLRSLGDDELAEELDEIERTVRVLEAERARRLAEFERRGAQQDDGFLSVSAWLVARHRLAPSTAARRVRVARAMASMPRSAEASSAGELSDAAIDLLASARGSHPEAFARTEEALVQAARTLPVSSLRSVVSYWRQAQDMAEAETDEDERFGRRRLHVSPTLGGMVRVDGDLDPEGGQLLLTALRAVMDADAHAHRGLEFRTSGQRRADALGEICRTWMDSSDRPAVLGERPHVLVTLDLEALEGRVGRSELVDVGPVTPETARRLACDAKVSRIITSPGSQPLDVGRSSKVIPPALRRAVIVRDAGCRFPGCGRPPSWCDAHHIRHWADGGRTALDNLVLLCRPHHRAIHRGFAIQMVDGFPVFGRAEGAPLDDGRSSSAIRARP